MYRPTGTRFIDLQNQHFGMWLVIEYAGNGGQALGARWRCRCKCGVEREVLSGNLRSGKSTGCGCNRKSNKRHGHCTQELRGSATYTCWANMRQRCNNENNHFFADYGGRGISVCERWKSFDLFLADMGEKPSRQHTLDRIDNDGNYCPENCRWATAKQQGRNKRNSRLIECRGETKTLAEWSEISGVKYTSIHQRLRHGWDAESAIFQKA